MSYADRVWPKGKEKTEEKGPLSPEERTEKLREFKTKYPNLYRAIFAEGVEQGKAEGIEEGKAVGLEEGFAKGIEHEKTRPKGQSLPEGPEKWKAEFESDPGLQAEFRACERYVAYKQGVSQGRVKILGKVIDD